MRLSRLLARAVRDAIFPHRSDLAAELRRYKGNNDNILTALTEAGVPVPQEDDGVLRSYWMVRDVIEERDAARAEYHEVKRAYAAHLDSESTPAVTRPRPEVPAERRRAILRAAQTATTPTAEEIAREVFRACENGRMSGSTITRLISDLAADGYLAHDGKRPRAYSLTAKGVADIAEDVAQTVKADEGEGRRNCWTCALLTRKSDAGDHVCKSKRTGEWRMTHKPLGKMPPKSAPNCPGYEARS